MSSAISRICRIIFYFASVFFSSSCRRFERASLPSDLTIMWRSRFLQTSGSSWSKRSGSFSRLSRRAGTPSSLGRSQSTRLSRGWTTQSRNISNPPISWSSWSDRLAEPKSRYPMVTTGYHEVPSVRHGKNTRENRWHVTKLSTVYVVLLRISLEDAAVTPSSKLVPDTLVK